MNAKKKRSMLWFLQHYYNMIQTFSDRKTPTAQEALEWGRRRYNQLRDALAKLGYSVEYDKHSKKPIAITKNGETDEADDKSDNDIPDGRFGIIGIRG